MCCIHSPFDIECSSNISFHAEEDCQEDLWDGYNAMNTKTFLFLLTSNKLQPLFIKGILSHIWRPPELV
jgi:hypothetical protein